MINSCSHLFSVLYDCLSALVEMGEEGRRLDVEALLSCEVPFRHWKLAYLAAYFTW